MARTPPLQIGATTPAFVAATLTVPGGNVTWEYKSELDMAPEAAMAAAMASTPSTH